MYIKIHVQCTMVILLGIFSLQSIQVKLKISKLIIIHTIITVNTHGRTRNIREYKIIMMVR